MTMSTRTEISALATPETIHPTTNSAHSTPWLTVSEAAGRARCGPKLIYREVQAGRLQAAKVGGRRELRIRAEWVDAWLLAQTTT
jgi:excisionase family DNA binding protein